MKLEKDEQAKKLAVASDVMVMFGTTPKSKRASVLETSGLAPSAAGAASGMRRKATALDDTTDTPTTDLDPSLLAFGSLLSPSHATRRQPQRGT